MMKKLSVMLLASMAVPFGAMADEATASFTSNVASYCTVGQITPGLLHLTGQNITTDSPAIMQVNNNDANVYKISATDAGDFTVKPNGYTGTATLTTSMTVTGANPGNVESGQELNLVNTGSDTIEVNVSGSSDQEIISGDYAATAVVSCIAQ